MIMVKIMEGLKKVGGWLFSGRGQNPKQNKKKLYSQNLF